MSENTTLAVKCLRTHFSTEAGVVKAVDGISFSVQAGEVMGIVGESGSGKSITAFSILDLVNVPGCNISGQILFQGEDLRTKSQEQLRRIRGNKVAMIFQDPMMTLNPVLRIDTQMIETLQAHENISTSAARARALTALQKVGIAAAEERLSAYPHQLSGGMRQRIAIAIALLFEPKLIIADEPTTALDVTIQAQILFEMQRLCKEMGMALIWITHDISVLAQIADTVCVMYAGKFVEQGPVETILTAPAHPYTCGLLHSIPGQKKPGEQLQQISGYMPSLLDLPQGCAFSSRCRHTDETCSIDPGWMGLTDSHQVRCHFPERRQT